MKSKTIVTAALLLFVAVSVIYLVVKETREKSEHNPAHPGPATSQTGREQDKATSASSEKPKTASMVVVYYFHGNARCGTCHTIEDYAKEAVYSGFADEIKNGRLEWRVVNVDEPGNEHYVEDFQLVSTASVVLERLAGGKRQEWKNLQRVWELVRGEKDDFLKYVQKETRGYLEAAGK